MKRISWMAGNGKEVDVIHVTEEQNIADHTVTNKVDKINITLGGESMIYQGIVDGMIQVMGGKIRIPDDKKIDVLDMINGVAERREERMAASKKIEKDYNANYNKIKDAMGE